MSNVVAFPKKPPQERTYSGPAFCLACKHEWEAEAPEGVVSLECPSCGTMKGLYRYEHAPHKDTALWTCKCDNQLFLVTPQGIFCPNCGIYAEFP